MLEQEQNSQLSQTLAAIDIGSNSIRMTVGQLLSDGTVDIIERANRPVRLGQDCFRYFRLMPATMRAAINILREFKRRIDEYQVKHIWTVATNAVREARNADVFLDRILMACGLEAQIIDASQERRITVSAVRAALNDKPLDFGGSQALICEVGGGSTMMTIMRHDKLISSQSLVLGSIRIQEVLGTAGRSIVQAADLIENEIESALASVESLVPLARVGVFIAVGADARFTAAQIGVPTENPKFHRIARRTFEEFVRRNRQLSVEQLALQSDIPYSDAETMLPALLIFQSLLRLTRAKEIIVPSVSMRDGLLLELSRRCRGQVDESIAQEAVQSAMALAEKYRVNLHHARRVADCALRLYDEMKTVHGLGFRPRLLLEAAALLHECGAFVSTRAYHKHTYYLVANSEIYGLTPNEVVTVAHIARYHRRSSPKASHLEYTALPQESRILVNKLAAILRLAKALDITDIRQIDRIHCRLDQDSVRIQVPDLSNESLVKQSVEMRSSLFEDVFGLNLELEPLPEQTK
jgi:exopolyphosphatase/guanosine-5'-triphosphate,3'-diphosphate pyrophosphatase